ncbi:MAG: sodium:calcium antiporter [Candidatus Binatia bacterium]
MVSLVLLVLGIGLVLWSAERLTDGVLGAAASFAVSAFFVGALVSGFEPENLVTGIVANLERLPQVALGTVIGSAVFMILGGFGAAILIVPMKVEVPRPGILVMIASLLLFGLALLNDGMVSRWEGFLLLVGSGALMVRLYRTSPVLLARSPGELEASEQKPSSRSRALLLIGLGILGTLLGAELLVQGAAGVIQRFGISETFVGMTIVGLGESLEETARMVAPARRGRYDVALGNVVGTTIILLTFNLGLIALVRPITADPWVVKFHAPYLIVCVLLVGALLLVNKRLERWVGALLISLYLLYLAVNLRYL